MELIGSLLSNGIDTIVWTVATHTKAVPAPKMSVTIGTAHFKTKLIVEYRWRIQE
jgi:hypothetical protein